ncbi:hypothetical protein GQ54DRAFT_238561, partial [Martensiomyces pterosporus]
TAQEAVQDLKQVVSESPNTIEYSCFYLALDGQRLNDFAELGEIEGLQKDSQLELFEDQYTEREARLHVGRLRDLLAGPTTADPLVAGLDAGASIFSTIKYPDGTPTDLSAAADGGDSDFEFGKVSQFNVISTSEAIKKLSVPQCIKQITLSGWNPVPRYRQLNGDLMYLLVTTLENQNYHITASRDGFFVNASSLTHFNPEQYGVARAGQQGTRDPEFYCAHSLITLLKKLSPRFGQGLAKLQQEAALRDSVEVLPFVSAEHAASTWLVRSGENRAPESYDAGRPQEVYLRLGSQISDSLRDWNEELQSIREMPRGNLSERVLRDRQIHKWHSEFAEAAIHGAMAVVEDEMPPLNPTDPSEQHMYLRDNIFFSKGFDGRETFTELGGDEAAHVATGKDITGVRLLNQLDVEGLNTLGSVVVDYRGVRVVAQSVVPGIFRRQDTTQIIYGSVDSGATVGSDPEFHKAMEPVAKALHFAEHSVFSEAGEESKLYTSVDVKGLVGTDGRKYLLDLYRMTPIDVEFLESECEEKADAELPAYPHKLVLMRPELLDIFWESKIRKAVQEYAIEKTKSAEAAKDEAADKTEGAGEAQQTPEEKDEPKPADDAQAAEESGAKDLLGDFDFSLNFSPDAFTPIEQQRKGTSESDKELSSAVRSASKFLREVSVPSLARDLASYSTSPLSGSALVTAMHQRGINMRYLGMIASLLPSDVESAQNVRRLVVHEMISRAAKHILRDLFRLVPARLHSEVFAHVVNALICTEYCADPTAQLSAEARAIPELASLTPEALADLVKAQVALRFRFALPDDFVGKFIAGSEHILLREVCLKAGAQIAMRQYYFARPAEEEMHAIAMKTVDPSIKLNKQMKRQIKEQVDKELSRPMTLLPGDVMNFVALTKVSTHNSSFADEAFEAGRMSLEQGQKELGLELLLESLALHEQTFGFLHSESARCYAVVSLAHYDAGEYALAAEFMTKSVIISERTVGLDDPLTIHDYLNLALYEHARGNTLLALRLMRHAMDLWNLVNSPDHPDLATAHNNIGVMLQSLRQYDDALKFFKSCLEIRSKLLGTDNVLVANAMHSLAKAYAVTGDFKSAVQVERDSHKFFSEKFGDEDPRTKETAEWLKELTFNAVRSAKLSSAARKKLSEAVATAGLMQMERDGRGAAEASSGAPGGTSSKGHLPIDDLLKFITGSTNPKPRGGRRGR